MKKIYLGTILTLFVLVGAFFVSADLNETEVEEVEEVSSVDETCGIDTCGGQCGGGCGIPKCGCSR